MTEHTIRIEYEQSNGNHNHIAKTYDHPLTQQELEATARYLPYGAVIRSISVDTDVDANW